MSLFVTKDNPTDLWLGSKVVNDTYYRFRVQADGKILWGNGTSDQDTQLARTNANELSIFKGNSSTYGSLNLNSALLAFDVPQIDLNNLVLPTRTSLGYGNILFKHTGSQHNYPDDVYTSLFLVMVQDPSYPNNYTPILATDHGLWVEKDIQTYGALFTSSDPAKGYGGGAILMGHGLTGASDKPKISLVDSDQGYDTLYIKMKDGTTAAKLNLGKLEVQSTNNVFAVTAGDNGANQDTYLIPQNPSQGGLGLGTTAYPFKWVDATAVFTNSINYLNGGTITVSGVLSCDSVVHGGGSNGDAFRVGDDIYLVDVNEQDTLCLQGLQTRANAKIYFGSGRDCAIYRASTNILEVANSIYPSTYNMWHLGSNTKYWNSVWANYLKYHTSCTSFDTIDDLETLKKIHTITDGEGKQIHDPETLVHLKDADGFYSQERMDGWHISIQKRLLERIEMLEKKIEKLTAS